MQIHLCKPGGQREGPYTLEQINADLAANRYSDSDYWAWHEGLSDWVPLHSLPGIGEVPPSGTATAAPAEASADEPGTAGTEPVPDGATVEIDSSLGTVETDKLSSGMPFAALEHSFLLTSGPGPSSVRSQTTERMLQQIIGEDLEALRQQVPRDVIAECKILEEVQGQGPTPPAVWQKLAALRPELLKQARNGLFRVCVRSFRIETGDIVSVVLFYNKEKL